MDQEITTLINQLHDLREDWHMIEDEHKIHLEDIRQVSREAQALKVMLGLSWVINGIVAWMFMDTSSSVTIEPTVLFNHT
jgi:hypothetical protein